MPSPPNPHIASHLRQLIYYHLDCDLPRNSLAFAERLRGYEPKSSEAAYLEGLCYYRLGQLNAAYHSTKLQGTRGTHLGCSYIFGQACLGLERYGEGIAATEKSKHLWVSRNNWNKHTESRRQQLPDAAALYCLQGKLWHGFQDLNKAIDCYAEALKLNPFMWDAFLGLCDLGASLRVDHIFKMTPEMTSALSSASSDENSSSIPEVMPLSNSFSQSNTFDNSQNQPPVHNDPFSISKNRINGDVRPNAGSSALFEKLNGSRSVVTPVGGAGNYPGLDTPTGVGGAVVTEIHHNKDAGGVTALSVPAEPPHAPMRKARTLQGMGVEFGTDAPPKMSSNSMRSKSRNSNRDTEETDSASQLSRTSTMSNAGGGHKRTISGQAPQSSTANSLTSSSVANVTDPLAAPQRRSTRLINQFSGRFASSSGSLAAKEGREVKKVKATGTKGRSANAFNVGRVVSGNRKYGDTTEFDRKETKPASNISAISRNPKPAVTDKLKETESLQVLLDLFRCMGSGYFALCHYQCSEALQLFNAIPQGQRDTPWVSAQIGRALYEQNSYAEAEKYFSRIKTMAPARLEDMEVYSTVLWHEKNEIDLAFLAHEIVELDYNSPQAWCVVGNSFSLQDEHGQALKCFTRATQLNPKFAYAFTLQGHEHVFNEEYDKALAAYRAAVAADKRHYSAWYGLGRVYERQGKYVFAERHYRSAASINPNNAVLICCIGFMLEKMKNPRAALIQYSRSCDVAPKNSLARLRKARVLTALQEPDLALQELKVLLEIAPDEANVHFLIGRVYKALRQKASAIRHFTTALNLDPKASQKIKEAMEQMEDDDEDEDPDGMNVA